MSEAVEASVRVTFVTNERKVVTAPANSNLLRVSLREKGGIPWKCGGGLCGTCRCLIEAGREHLDKVKPKERKHLSEADLAARVSDGVPDVLRGGYQRVVGAEVRGLLRLELAEARVMAEAALAEAARLGVGETVCIADEGGFPIVVLRGDGARITGPEIAANKAFTAAGHRRSTHLFNTPPGGRLYRGTRRSAFSGVSGGGSRCSWGGSRSWWMGRSWGAWG